MGEKVLTARTLRHVAAGLLIVGLHLALVQVFLPLSAVLQPSPMGGDDLDTHIGQTYRLIAALAQGGHHFQYTPYLLAGFPAGAIFDADNKGWAYLSYLLYRYGGLPPGQAFNVFIYLASALPPIIGMLAARLFGFRAGVTLLAGLLCSLYWHFDSFVHWCFWIGMEAYAFAGYFALLPLALFHRFVASRKVRYALMCAPVLAVAHTLHPYTFFILAVPMGVLYVRNGRSFTKGMHLGVGVIGALTLAVNLPWLSVSLSHWHHILNSAYFAQGGLNFLVADLFNQLISPTDTGVIGTRAALRFVYGILAACAVVGFVRRKELVAQSLGVAVGLMYFFSYLGAYVPGLGQIQPYRHVIPAGFCAALAAASILPDAVRSLLVAPKTLPMRAGLLAMTFLAVQHLCFEVGYFLPTLSPTVQPLLDGTRVHLDASGYPHRMMFSLPHNQHLHGGVNELVARMGKLAGRNGRVVVEDMVLGERMAWREVTEVIGGFRLRNMEHALANILRTHEGKVISERALRRYVRAYGITHFVMALEHPEFDEMPSVLTKVEERFGRRIYAVVDPAPKLQGSSGHVVASANRLAVRGTDPEADVVLRYHFHPALRCAPDCEARRTDVDWPDPVGFIRIPAPHPADFLVYNSYE